MFAVASGAVPDGLALDPLSGLLSGVPARAGVFTFTISASNGVTPDADTPGLTITIGATGPPQAADDVYTVQTGRELDVAAPGVLSNDASLNPGRSLTAVLQHDAGQGVVQLRGDGSFSYVPAAGFTGDDSFTYVVRDNTNAFSNPAMVSITVTSGGPATAAIAAMNPTTGTTVTGPVNIAATLMPPSGETITSWTISYRRPEDSNLTQLASGSGTNVAATFDPTLLRDGTYAINIRASSSGGGVFETESGLIVDGTYKPGRYATTFQDMNINAANIPIAVQRTYDSVNLVPGDFGVGWSVSLADFRIDTNGPLGSGGWTTFNCGSFPFLQSCYKTTVPHVVSVTWPDGHVEKFDLTPQSSFLPGSTSSAYTAEAGSTSSLQAIDNGLQLRGSNFFAGGLFGVSQMYDPLQFILTAKNGTKYTIDRHAGLLSQADTNGNTLTIDNNGIHSSSGPSVSFNRDASNRISQIVGPTGSITYTYSAAGDLTNVAYPNGATQSFTYDAAHDLLTITGGGQLVRTLTYDASGRITAVTDGNGNTSTIAANVAGHQQVFTDATGVLTTINTYDDRGDVIQQDQTFAGKTITTQATYNAIGLQLTVTDPLGHSISQTYDAANNVVSRTNANGQTTTYTYNTLGEPLTVTDATGAVTASNTYDAHGLLLTMADANGHASTFTYDSAGHLLSTTDALGRTTTRTYDSAGQLVTVTDPGGNTTRQNVDPATGRVRSITDPTGATTSFAYDADGNLTDVADASGHTRGATFDSFDRVTSVTDAAGASDHMVYDGAGNMVSVTDRNGDVTAYTYDADSRLISKIMPGAGTSTYTYDPLGRLVSAVNATAELAFTYDDGGRLLSTTSTGLGPSPVPSTSFTYAYDAVGNLTFTQGPTGTTSYAYDSVQRLTTLTDPAGGRFDFGYDPTGRLTSLIRPNGINDAIAYNAAGDLITLHSNLGPTVVNQADYTYNSAGLRGSLTTTAGTTTYAYDAASQLTSAIYPGISGLPADTYTYDPVGNRISTSTSPLGSFAYDGNDRLVSDATTTYAYDNEGNLVKRITKATGETTSYTWSAEHQLIGITRPDGTATVFRYDPLRRPVEIDEGTSVTRYAYDEKNIAAEYDATNTLTAAYVHDPTQTNRQLEMVRGGQRYFYLSDAQRSTTVLATLTGSVATSYTYTAFGTPSQSGDLINPFAYTGQFYEPKAGLLLFPLRGYDPALGRFASEDTLPSVNPYTYVLNSPPNLTDPTGAQAFGEYVYKGVWGCASSALISAGFGGARAHYIWACIFGFVLGAAKVNSDAVVKSLELGYFDRFLVDASLFALGGYVTASASKP